MDTEASERAEGELDTYIARADKRRRETEGERAREQLWVESVRRYYAHVGETRRLERLAYHEGQAKRLSSTLEALVRHHEAEAEKYRTNGYHEEGA